MLNIAILIIIPRYSFVTTKDLVLSLHQTNPTIRNMKGKNDYTLTKSEMQVMNALWGAGKALDVHEVMARYNEPRPAYTTISTFLKILTTKGFVDYKKGNGKQYLYFPVVSRAEYTSRVMKEVKDNFFGGSASSLVRFFVEEEQLSETELKELLSLTHNV